MGACRDATEGVPSLHRICERIVAAQAVEPRTACDVLQWADAADATMLRRHCLVGHGAHVLASADAHCHIWDNQIIVERVTKLEGIVSARCSRAPVHQN